MNEQSASIAHLTEESERQEREAEELLTRLFNLRMDTLVDDAFTPEGLRDHLEHDAALQEVMQSGRWGVVRLDGRFVRYVNKYGNRTGDGFLQAGGARIAAVANGLGRRGDRRRQGQGVLVERRQGAERRQTLHPAEQRGHTHNGDVICRQGGDEFALIMVGVDEKGLATAATRIQNALTVGKAVDNYTHGRIPFIASVGQAHASARHADVLRLIDGQDFWGAFNAVNGVADEGQRTSKARQYQEMWELVTAATPPDQQRVTVAMPDESVIASEFLRVLCPKFYENPIAFLEHAQQTGH